MNRSLVNERMKAFDDTNRPVLNTVVRVPRESPEHFDLKYKVAQSYIRRGYGVVTGGVLKKSLTKGFYFKVDVAVLDHEPPIICEVVVSEKRESVARKYKKCPKGWMFLVEEIPKSKR